MTTSTTLMRTTDDLKVEQEKTLQTHRMKYGFLASLLFWSMNLFYGRERSLSKFKCCQSAKVGQIGTREDYCYEELRVSSLRVLL